MTLWAKACFIVTISNTFRHASACGEIIIHSAWFIFLWRKLPDTSANYIESSGSYTRGTGQRHGLWNWKIGNYLQVDFSFRLPHSAFPDPDLFYQYFPTKLKFIRRSTLMPVERSRRARAGRIPHSYTSICLTVIWIKSKNQSFN